MCVFWVHIKKGRPENPVCHFNSSQRMGTIGTRIFIRLRIFKLSKLSRFGAYRICFLKTDRLWVSLYQIIEQAVIEM